MNTVVLFKDFDLDVVAGCCSLWIKNNLININIFYKKSKKKNSKYIFPFLLLLNEVSSFFFLL